eukprot:CAMPEP_0119541698 /NCGR_PEP_ID=MMETSP1344-20130328/53119_1 /TAXON_ID=236787 /ORGANISM="Florenciella parvula, Strain CCMP2471" /LENGTH=199 /DNA_ID=CAMNT_0007585737 /DNA_START=42 /DNA_END=641 /DNA_ORIENTATION=+
MMMRTVAALSLALVGHAYVLPAHQARCVLPAQQARASRRLVVGMSDPLKDDMSDPEAKGFAYDALAPLYGNNPLKGVASGVAKKETGRRAPIPGKEKTLFQKVGPLVFFSAVPLIIGAFAFQSFKEMGFNFEVLVRFNLEIAIGFGATIALIYWKAASEGRDLFNPEGKDDAAPMVDLEDAFGASVEETSSNDSAPPGL